MAAPVLSSDFLKRLQDLQHTLDLAECAAYGFDNSKQFAQPGAVVFAHDALEVQKTVKACFDFSVPLVARGRGTNTTGAAIPLNNAVVLSVERMNQIYQTSKADRLCRCDSGTLNGDVQRAATEHALMWGPDPTSADYSTIGGNIACNAGGPRAVRYGTTRDNVLGLEFVTGYGELIKTGVTTTKGVVGYDLTRLMCGSEGTLGVVTQATLKLIPKPSAVATLRACFRDIESATAAVAAVMAQPEQPGALEFMDSDAIQLAQNFLDTGVPDGSAALLMLEAHANSDSLPSAISALQKAVSNPGLLEFRVAETAEDATNLWACRKALSPALRTLAPKKINEDVVVPVSRVPELIRGLGEIGARHKIRIVTFGHAGNGNIHVNLLGNPTDAKELAVMHTCLDEVFRLVLDLEGTISGEHGVGIAKRPYVAWEIAENALTLMRQMKNVFDPKGILNPGKTLP